MRLAQRWIFLTVYRGADVCSMYNPLRNLNWHSQPRRRNKYLILFIII
jgi:hypothetical protein